AEQNCCPLHHNNQRGPGSKGPKDTMHVLVACPSSRTSLSILSSSLSCKSIARRTTGGAVRRCRRSSSFFAPISRQRTVTAWRASLSRPLALGPLAAAMAFSSEGQNSWEPAQPWTRPVERHLGCAQCSGGIDPSQVNV